MDDDRQHKRKRAAQACRTCQTKKIRCDGKFPACTYCLNYNYECVFSDSQKKRGPKKSAAPKDLEKRLMRMEALLDKFRPTTGPESELPSPSLSQGPGEDASCILMREEMAQDLMMAETTPPADPLPPGGREAVPILECMKPSQIDSSAPNVQATSPCSFTPSSPSGNMEYSPPVQWIRDNTDGNSAIKAAFPCSTLVQPSKPEEMVHTCPRAINRPVYVPIPPKEEVLHLTDAFFQGYNKFFPLFHPHHFMELVEKQFSGQPDERVGWWASLNAVIAIGARLQEPECRRRNAAKQSWDYMNNAFGVLPELTAQTPDLLNAQALLGMAIFSSGNGQPQAAAMLVTMALRLLQMLGFHRKKTHIDSDPVLANQGRRAFWIACGFDRDMCITSKLPLVQHAMDIDIDLPPEDPPDGLGDVSLSENGQKINFFRIMTDLSVIQAEVHQYLQSVEENQKLREDLLKEAIRLDQELEKWKIGIPVDFQPEYEINTSDTYLRHNIIILHFGYYNCLSNIHHACVRLGKLYEASAESVSQSPSHSMDARIITSGSIHASAARAMVRLIQRVCTQTPAFVWRLLCYPVIASINLFVSIWEDPSRPRALTDVKLLESMVTFLSKVEDANMESIRQIYRIFSELERIARETVDKAQQISSGQKPPRQIQEGSEDVPSRSGADTMPIADANIPQNFTSLIEDADPQITLSSNLPMLWGQESFYEDLLGDLLPRRSYH